MLSRRGTLLPLLLAGAVHAVSSNTTNVCQQIAAAISSASAVYYPLDIFGNYDTDISHYASSSTENASCSVEPGTPEDVGIILQILGETQTPFGVKSGGHIMNPGFSSSTGVEIALYRFSGVTYDASTQTAQVGSGLIWDDVYAALEPYGVNVPGARVTGIGVGGFSLGGGYTWLTNQYGLTIDNILQYQLVLPSGDVVTVSESEYPDLFFGLRGGFNNFGIVTQFTFKTYPQGQVWGGIIQIDGYLYADAFNNATANFANNVTDPKAGMLMAYDYTVLGLYLMTAILFYDAPTQPSGIFDDFLAIPAVSSSVSTQSFLSLIQASPSNITSGTRGYFHTVPVETLSPAVINAVYNQSLYYGSALALDTDTLLSYDLEPFLPDILTHGSDSAYPASRTQRYLPINIYFAWSAELADETFYNALVATQQAIHEAAIADGQNVADAPLYPNYALYDTSIDNMYGSNLPTLQALRAQYDPNDTMGLAGGWKF